MSSIGDLTVNVSCDASELTAGMTESRQQIEQTITTIELQDTSWKSLAGTTLMSIAKIAGPVISLISAQKQLAAAVLSSGAASAVATPPTLTLAAAVNFLLSPIVLIAAAVAAAAAVFYIFSGSSDEAAESTGKTSAATKKLGDTADETGVKLSASARVLEGFNVGSHMDTIRTSVASVGDAAGEVKTAFSGLTDALVQPFVDASFEVGAFIGSFLGVEEKASLATRALQGVAEGIQSLTSWTKAGIATVTLLGHQLATGSDAAAAQAWLEQRDAIQAVAIEAEHLRVSTAYADKEISAQIEEATKAAQRQAEVTRVGTLTSIEAIDQETEALKQQIIQLQLKGKYGESEKKHTEEMAKALATRREGIDSGKVKSPVDTALKAAREELDKLTNGEDAAAVAALKAKGATDAQIESLKELQTQTRAARQAKEDAKAIDDAIESARNALYSLENGQEDAALAALMEKNATQEQLEELDELLAATRTVTAAKAAQKAADEALKKAAADRAALDQQGVDKITSLKDQIDLLNGSATAAEIAMRELSRAGFSQEQINEIGTLTAELDRLKEQDKKPGKDEKGDKTNNKAAFEGSAEAASIMLRGVGADVATQQLDVSKKQLAELGKIAAGVAANSPGGAGGATPALPQINPGNPLPAEGVAPARKPPPLGELRALSTEISGSGAAQQMATLPQAGFFNHDIGAQLGALSFAAPAVAPPVVPKIEPPKFEPLRIDPLKFEPIQPLRLEELKSPRFEIPKPEPFNIEPPKLAPLKFEPPKFELPKRPADPMAAAFGSTAKKADQLQTLREQSLSAPAASILRGEPAGSTTKSDDAMTKKQLAALGKIEAAVKANKPPTLSVAKV
jgi:PHD/YefM family antitoxin component YafN of YafNO toxin-antitoxin module